ncbi:esterase [Mycolicibacterium brumae]|uniref:Esterase n=1 Tax=Mycolicibacterium brumae TaxID=85968 RepID=A0A2G5P645_9MYCO|nr:esterase [Mycolicibacterium brumae]MCV7193755.1 esterase [Mycolicibacterium brumae]PIB73839.1 esterase [Mycolicibacterium brumae]RWA19032.1 hypothetical protein MBRU_17400 [Mycolicibacterium brumae DSM 44177]UWW08458.1 alpha/beta hydrolase [Mycolicibacterium brumae]
MTETTTVEYTAGDGMVLTLKHVRGAGGAKGPVLLVPGAGVRAELFCPPEQRTVVDALVDDGWDVWLQNWRSSIDVPLTDWDLDQAAVYDHPRAVAAVRAHTGADTVKAIVHCQGSSSFMLSAAAGLLPDVDVIVANSMALHPIVPPWARVKLRYVVPIAAPLLPHLDTRWQEPGHPAPNWIAKALVAVVRATHRECENSSCRMVSFTYGAGRPALWSHDNISEATHNWLRSEFGAVPMSFFKQMARSVRRGQLTPTGRFAELPVDLLDGPPHTDARIALLTGRDNRCFLPASQQQTYDYLNRTRPGGQQSLTVIDGYGHLDIFFARYGERDTFGSVLELLNA